MDAYRKMLARTGDYVRMLGAMIGSSAVRVMRESIAPTDNARSGRPGDVRRALVVSATMPTTPRVRTCFRDTRTAPT